jgi:hypothetical protein
MPIMGNLFGVKLTAVYHAGRLLFNLLTQFTPDDEKQQLHKPTSKQMDYSYFVPQLL